MVRDATMEDLGHFLRMWPKFMQELDASYEANDTPYSSHNMNRYRALFCEIVKGYKLGVVMFWFSKDDHDTPHGVLLIEVGKSGDFEVRWENPAWVHGVYFEPEYRVLGGWRTIYRTAKNKLKDMGVTHVLGFVTRGNENVYKIDSAMGAKPYAILMELEL